MDAGWRPVAELEKMSSGLSCSLRAETEQWQFVFSAGCKVKKLSKRTVPFDTSLLTLLQQCAELFLGHGPCIVEALDHIASHIGERIRLLLRLDTFGDYVKSE